MAHQIFKTAVKHPISWILLGSLLIRLWGITYALPQFFINDERANVYGALKMLELKTLIPALHDQEFRQVLYYLPVPSYLYLIVLTPVIAVHFVVSGAHGLAAYKNLITLDPTVLFIAARASVACLGVIAVYLTYRVSSAITENRRASLLAALFLAVSFYHVQLSHVTRHWMPAAVFLLLAWLAAARIYNSGSWRAYLLGALAAAFGVGANTAAAVAMIPLLLAHFMRPGATPFPGRIKERFRDKRVWAMVAVFLIVSLMFIALYPYGLTQGEVGQSGGEGNFLQGKVAVLAGKNISGWLSFLWFYVRLAAVYETLLLVAALFGVMLMARKHPSWLVIMAVFTLSYLTLLYLFFNIIERAILFLLPLLAISAGYAAERGLAAIKSRVHTATLRHGCVGIFFVLLFAWPLAVNLRYDYLLTKTDTRLQAADWIYQHVPAKGKLLADLSFLRLTNTRQGIHELEAIDPSGLRVQDRVLLGMDGAVYPQPSVELLNLHFVRPDSPERLVQTKTFFTAEGYRWFAVEYGYEDLRDVDPQSRALMVQGKLVKRFLGFPERQFDRALDVSGEIASVPPWEFWKIERFGRIVDIYAL